jgi:hypothetical protein
MLLQVVHGEERTVAWAYHARGGRGWLLKAGVLVHLALWYAWQSAQAVAAGVLAASDAVALMAMELKC